MVYVWIGSVVVAALITSSRGRGIWPGVVLGVLLGPIGALICLVMRAPDAATPGAGGTDYPPPAGYLSRLSAPPPVLMETRDGVQIWKRDGAFWVGDQQFTDLTSARRFIDTEAG